MLVLGRSPRRRYARSRRACPLLGSVRKRLVVVNGMKKRRYAYQCYDLHESPKGEEDTEEHFERFGYATATWLIVWL